MTMIVETPRVSYVGDGVEDTFATTFTFEVVNEVTVWRGAPTVTDCCDAPAYDNLLQPDVDYYWLPGDYLADGGSIQVRAHAVIADGQIVTLMRTTPPDQPEGYGDLEEFTPEQAEASYDRIVRMVQELYHNPLGFLLLGGLIHTHRLYSPDAWGSGPPMDVYNVPIGIQYPANFSANVGSVETYPSAAISYSIQNLARAVVGAVHVPATSGAITYTTTLPAALSMARGQQVRLVPPADEKGCTGLAVTFVAVVV